MSILNIKYQLKGEAYSISAILCLLFFLVLELSCTKEILPPEEVNRQTLPLPGDLRINVGNNQANLFWDYPDSIASPRFRIFRQDSDTSAFFMVGVTEHHTFLDTSVENGVLYSYQIQVIGTEGKFSARSETVLAQPNIYGLILENGQAYTNKTTITIQLIAPANTEAYSISENMESAPINWQPFSSTILWTFLVNDGMKKIDVRFRDQLGIVIQQIFSDSIFLDTRVQITDFEISTKGNSKTLSAGDTLHVRMNTGESGGNAVFSLGQLNAIPLYDDGTNGDLNPNDGSYANEYIIPQNVEFISERVRGDFTDIAGNASGTIISDFPLTVQNLPDAVQLYPPVVNDSTSVTLRWSQNQNTDFFCYKIFFSQTPGISNELPANTEILNQEQTSFTFDNLLPNRWYYFKILVVDLFNLNAGSNEVSVELGSIRRPDAVTLNNAASIKDDSVLLSWESSSDVYFHFYEIVRWDSIFNKNLPFVIKKIYEINLNEWQDSGLRPNTGYYYQVRVYNIQGEYSESNVINVTTILEDAPQPVTLYNPTLVSATSVRLTWSQNTEQNFEAYYIYRSEESPVKIEGSPIGFISDARNIEFTDQSVVAHHTYYYKVVVANTLDKYSESNEVMIYIEP